MNTNPIAAGSTTSEFKVNAVASILLNVLGFGGAILFPTHVNSWTPLASAIATTILNAIYIRQRGGLKNALIAAGQAELAAPSGQTTVERLEYLATTLESALAAAPAAEAVSAPVTTVTGAGLSYTVTGPHGFGTSSPTEDVGVAEEVEPVVEPPVTVIEADPVDGPLST